SLKLFAWGRHVKRVGTGEDEAVALCWIVQRELLGDGAALRVAKYRSGGGIQLLEQPCEVSRQVLNRVAGRKPSAPAMASQVRHDHTMSGREAVKHWREHLTSDHEPMHEQERRTRANLCEIEGSCRHKGRTHDGYLQYATRVRRCLHQPSDN